MYHCSSYFEAFVAGRKIILETPPFILYVGAITNMELAALCNCPAEVETPNSQWLTHHGIGQANGFTWRSSPRYCPDMDKGGLRNS